MFRFGDAPTQLNMQPETITEYVATNQKPANNLHMMVEVAQVCLATSTIMCKLSASF